MSSMDESSPTSGPVFEAAVRDLLRARIHRFQIFKRMGLTTPRFAAQMESTMNIYRETLKLESAPFQDNYHNVNALMDALQDYWTKVFSDLESITTLHSRMYWQREFLEKKLCEDYLDNMPYIVDPGLVWVAKSRGSSAERQQAAKALGANPDEMDDFYHKRVTSLVHEMMVDPDHVGRKLQAAAARDGQPGSDIQPLIDSCQWGVLAEVLVKDRVLVDRLFASPDKEKTGTRIIHGIDRVQKKYFETLTSPARFVISARAGALSAKAIKEAKISPSLRRPPPYSDSADADKRTGEQVEKEKGEYSGS